MDTIYPQTRLDRILTRCYRVIPRNKKPTPTMPFRWPDLPSEIRLMILSIVAARKSPGWAALASVCKDWQQVIEKVNFEKIKLGAWDLGYFKAFAIPQRRELIHHILLEIVLPIYTSPCCDKDEVPDNFGVIIWNAISTLFSILSSWNPAERLALELNIYSPSDSMHWFKNIILSSDDVEHDTLKPRTEDRHNDPRHGWLKGVQLAPPPRLAVAKLFESIYLNIPPIPQVKAVTSFILRRQLRRCLAPRCIARIFKSLIGLEHMTYEPWAMSAARKELHSRSTHPIDDNTFHAS